MATTTDSKKYPYMAFSTVNRRVEPYLMKDDELWDSVNFWTEGKVGAKKVRPGYKTLFNAVDANPVRGLFYVKFPDQTVRLIRISGKSIYAVDPNSAANWGTAKLTLATNNFYRPDATVLNGLVHIVTQISSTESHYIEGNSSDTYTDTTYTSSTDPVVPYKALTCCQYHRRVYIGSPYDGTNMYRSYISYSSIDYQNKGTTPSTPWTTQSTLTDVTYANTLPIDKDYAGGVIKLTNINDRLMIYKEEGIYRYNETSIMDIFGLSPIQGSIATMKEIKSDVFLTNEGFFMTDGQSTKPIGEGFYPIIKQMFQNTTTVLDPTQIHSFSVNFLYFCYVGTIGYDGKVLNNACFVYNAYYNEMYLWNMGHHITSFGYYINSAKEKVIVMGDVNGNTYQMDFTDATNDDAGVPIRASMKTKYFFFDSPEKLNKLKGVYSFADLASEIEVMADKDFAGEYKLEVATLKGNRAKKKKDPSLLGQFGNLSFEFLWNGKGVRPEVYGIMPDVEMTSERMNSNNPTYG